MKKINLYTLILGLMLVLAGCDDPSAETLFSETFVELDAATTPANERTYTYLRENDGVSKPSRFKVDLASKPLSVDVEVSFEILSTSTAIQGVHYEVSGSSVTIPAGENIAELPIRIMADNIEPGEIFTIVVKITSSSVEIQSGLDQATHKIQISCESDIAGTYNTVASGNYGAGGAQSYSNLTSVVTLTETDDPTVYTIDDMSFGLYGAAYGDASPSGRMQDICDSMSDIGDTDQYDDPFTIAGTRDPATGVITLTWSNTYGDSGNVVLTPQ